MPRTLYSGTKNASSWAFRAWLALVEADVEFEEIVVDIRRPQRDANLAAIAKFSPPGAVPVLVDGGTVIFDSLAIMEYANDLSGGRLLPKEPLSRARARALLAWQHAGLSGIGKELPFESAFWPERRATHPEENAEIARLFEAWESELTASGGPYLCGELSLPDLAFVPTVIRLLAYRPEITPYPRAVAWCERLLARDSVAKWMQVARQQPPVFAS